jgi:hypothetical protein
MLVSFHAVTVPGAPRKGGSPGAVNVTELFPCSVPKPVPDIVTEP